MICVSHGRCFSALFMAVRSPLCPPPGIMAILFSGIVMSHYTHHNLSPVTQILMQQTLRTVAFLCGEFGLCAVPFGPPRAACPSCLCSRSPLRSSLAEEAA